MKNSFLTLKAPAKINLFLEVTGQRKDGYHTLETIFQTIALYDTLTITQTSSPLRYQGGPPGIPAEKNLVVKAARAFLSKYPQNFGVSLKLSKSIPVGGGLGGGSADAAAVLAGLAKMTDQKLQNLSKTAVKLGADVPFFLQEGGTCLARGIGEKLTPLKPLQSFWVLLVNPGFPVATAEVFKALHKPLTNRGKVNKMRALLERGAPPQAWVQFLFNRLEDVVFPRYPEIRRIKRVLMDQGALGSLLTGSGATVFGIVSSREEGLKIKRVLDQEYRWKVWLTQSVQTGITIRDSRKSTSQS